MSIFWLDDEGKRHLWPRELEFLTNLQETLDIPLDERASVDPFDLGVHRWCECIYGEVNKAKCVTQLSGRIGKTQQ